MGFYTLQRITRGWVEIGFFRGESGNKISMGGPVRPLGGSVCLQSGSVLLFFRRTGPGADRFLYFSAFSVCLRFATFWSCAHRTGPGLRRTGPPIWLSFSTLTVHNFCSGIPIGVPFLLRCSWMKCLHFLFRFLIRIPDKNDSFALLTFLVDFLYSSGFLLPFLDIKHL